ncbi:hypothetical protein MSG28_014302 [Choristoneura fumiferana]|uniref:Uncharacterized protein n=1 Tax=Choristoneura fumiferana TaxID=7141 RepID=A0ACC0JGQ2_CHOFU|nr:hypothetical protein MSG28_014302 [Choristoneura fumiferana]
MKCGLWCLFGMLVFIIVEKLFATSEEEEEDSDKEPKLNGSIQQIEIEEIDKLLDVERRSRGKANGEMICGGNGTVTAKQLYDSCVFNNNGKGVILRVVGPCARSARIATTILFAVKQQCLHCCFGVESEGACCSTVATSNGSVRCNKGNRWMGRCLLREAREKVLATAKDKPDKKDVAGYLNLMANSIDNFTHGLAVGGSFLVGFRVGLLTTFAILVHEIPHEVGDFAILLKSGFSRWEAAKAQLPIHVPLLGTGLLSEQEGLGHSSHAGPVRIGNFTRTIELLRSPRSVNESVPVLMALRALLQDHMHTHVAAHAAGGGGGGRRCQERSLKAKTSWIVPFTAGGFLHIALVTVLPDLLREDDKWESLKHLGALLAGIAVMAFMTHYFG